MAFDRRGPQGQTIWSSFWLLVTIFNLDIVWGNLKLHRVGYHGFFTDQGRFIFWSVLLVLFVILTIRNGLLWRKKRALADATA